MFDLFRPAHLLFVLVVALGVFGPARLIETCRSMGRTLRRIQEFKEKLMNLNEDESNQKCPPPEAVDLRKR